MRASNRATEPMAKRRMAFALRCESVGLAFRNGLLQESKRLWRFAVKARSQGAKLPEWLGAIQEEFAKNLKIWPSFFVAEESSIQVVPIFRISDWQLCSEAALHSESSGFL